MPTPSTIGALTFVDIAKYNKGDTKLVIDCVAQRNDIYADMLIKPANNGDTEIVRARTDIAKAGWTAMYKGTTASKGSVASFRATCAMLSSKMELDKRIADKEKEQGTADAWLEGETKNHIDAMALEAAKALVYGRVKDNPLAFNGFMRHFAAHTSNDSKNPAYNVINGGGTVSNSLGSIILIDWSTQGVYAICPQGSKSGGIRVGAMKEVELHEKDDPSATYEGLMKYFYHDLGMVVADWRTSGRICNINRLAHQTASADELKTLAQTLMTKVDTLTGRCARRGENGRKKLYMDNLIWEQLKISCGVLTRSNAIEEKQLNGHTFRALNGIEVRINEIQEADEELVPAAQ